METDSLMTPGPSSPAPSTPPLGASGITLSPSDLALFNSGYEKLEGHGTSLLQRAYEAALPSAGAVPSLRGTRANGYLSDACWEKLNAAKLRVAASVNALDLAERLLAHPRHPVHPAKAADGKGRTPLHLAAARGYGDMIELLLRYGADPNAQDCRGNIPLHLAACNAGSKGSVTTVRALCEAGSDVLHRGMDGTTPIELSLSRLRAIRKSVLIPEDKKISYEQSFHILRTGLCRLSGPSSSGRPLEKIKSNLETLLTTVDAETSTPALPAAPDLDQEFEGLLNDLQKMFILEK